MPKRGPVGVGVIGTGVVSDRYLVNLTAYPDLHIVSIGDTSVERAASKAAEYGIEHSGTPAQVLAHPRVEIVVNATSASGHGETARQALREGKHVWNDQPLALDLEESHELVYYADSRLLLLGGAPDTVLGAGLQRSFHLLADGAIGTLLAANAVTQNPGPDRWDPDPASRFQEGAGPLIALGPAYLTVLTEIFGTIEGVAAFSLQARPVRSVQVGPNAGQTFPVTVDTHTAALIDFSNGGQAQLTLSYDNEVERNGLLEIIGSEGTLATSDPNGFDGVITVLRNDGSAPRVIPVDAAGTGPGVGVLEMARALRAGTPVRASGRTADYVHETIHAIQRAADERTVVEVTGEFTRAGLLPENWSATQLTLL